LKIGILGGTGNMGRGLTTRWTAKHDILIGSRSLEKAQRIAKELEKIARGFYQAEMRGGYAPLLIPFIRKEKSWKPEQHMRLILFLSRRFCRFQN